MTSPSTFVAAVWAFLPASKTRGLPRIRRDRDLARLDAAFADLDARHRQRLPGSTGGSHERHHNGLDGRAGNVSGPSGRCGRVRRSPPLAA
jgi:hypothetical protein